MLATLGGHGRRGAKRALTADNPHVALERLRAHRARFEHGLLREERRGLQVLALCASGAVADGTRLRDAFLRDSPRSVLAARVRSACQ